MHLRKEKAGASSHGYEWPQDGAVVEVEDHHGLELLRIADAGFSVADAPEPKRAARKTEPTPEAEAE
jgi:hypothetical protein